MPNRSFWNVCNQCEESIEKPSCIDCYLASVEKNMRGMKIPSINIEIILEKIRKDIPKEKLSQIECSSCNNDATALCQECFSVLMEKSELNELQLTHAQ